MNRVILYDLGREPDNDARTGTGLKLEPVQAPRPQFRLRGKGIAFLLQELKRRHVTRVTFVYAAIAFVVLQAIDLLVSGLSLPIWLFSAGIVLAMIGFPLVIALAWVFDITPLGIQRAEHAARRAVTPSFPRLPGAELARSPGAATLEVRRAALPDRHSIAVLPFVNLTDNGNSDIFADGVTAEIVARLADLSDLRVISRTSIMRYKGSTEPLRVIASALGVANILEGSVRQDGTRVRITANLIEAATDTHLWSQTFDRELCDVFAVQSEVAAHIGAALEANISEGERSRLRRHTVTDLQTYELYVQGRDQLERGCASSIRESIALLTRAIDHDPNFALAHATLADAYITMPYWGRAEPRLSYEAAHKAVERALNLDPELAEAHTADAALRIQRWDWNGAEAAIKRALALTPNSSAPFAWACCLAGLRTRFDEALSYIDEGLARDPYSPLLLGFKGQMLNYAGRSLDSLAVLRDLVQRAPEYGVGHLYLGLTLRSLRDHEAAVAAFRRAHELLDCHEAALGSMAHALVGLGWRTEAVAILESLLEKRTRQWIDPFIVASAAFAVGQIELGMDELEYAEAERSFFLPWIRPSLQMPIVAPLRAHPRMQALLHRIWPEDFNS